MSYMKINLAAEAKKAIKGKTTKVSPAVLLHLLSEDYLRTKRVAAEATTTPIR